MNGILDIKNWKEGGNNYVLRAKLKNKWSGFQDSVITELTTSFGDKFNIVIWADEHDYYCIPFEVLKHLFIDEYKTTGKYPNRWTAVILNHQFLMRSNSELSVDISSYYSQTLIDNKSEQTVYADEVDEDIEYVEGKTKKVLVNNYERNPIARKKCVEHFGVICQVCGFDFEKIYGKIGKDFIHIHP
jgi:hypothetical protein